jgi:hypothetical protein
LEYYNHIRHRLNRRKLDERPALQYKELHNFHRLHRHRL